MRPLYVPVRLAATVMAVAATAGCMSVGSDEGGKVKPSHSAGQRDADAPDGGPAGAGDGHLGPDGDEDGKHGQGRGRRGASAPPRASASPSARASASASPGAVRPGHSEKPGLPTPTRSLPPVPTRSPDPEPPVPSPEPPPSPSAEPTPAEPSSSAHEGDGGTVPQLVDREPAPEAGAPA